MCVCVWMCVWVWLCGCVHGVCVCLSVVWCGVCTCVACTHTHVCACVCTCVHACMCLWCVHICMCVCVNMYTHTMHMCVSTCTDSTSNQTSPHTTEQLAHPTGILSTDSDSLEVGQKVVLLFQLSGNVLGDDAVIVRHPSAEALGGHRRGQTGAARHVHHPL